MIGTILVEGLTISCIIGVHQHERESPQTLIIDCDCDSDFAAGAAADDITQTVDYTELAALLTSTAIEGRYRLLETFIEDAARGILERFQVSRVRLKVMKPSAIANARWSAVCIERRR